MTSNIAKVQITSHVICFLFMPNGNIKVLSANVQILETQTYGMQEEFSLDKYHNDYLLTNP